MTTRTPVEAVLVNEDGFLFLELRSRDGRRWEFFPLGSVIDKTPTLRPSPEIQPKAETA